MRFHERCYLFPGVIIFFSQLKVKVKTLKLVFWIFQPDSGCHKKNYFAVVLVNKFVYFSIMSKRMDWK